MATSCKNIKYGTRRTGKPIIQATKRDLSLKTSDDDSTESESNSYFIKGEADFNEDEISYVPPKNTIEELRKWLVKQRFIPQDLSDKLLNVFLSGVGYDLEAAKEKLHAYFYSRQEPSPLFRNRDPLSPENAKILEKLYVIPMPDTTQYGEKVILTGLKHQVTSYSPMEHAKVLAMVLDLLIWEKDFGFGNFIVVLDGRGFQSPQLLEKKVYNHRSITRMLLDTIPGTLRSFYLLYPPPHVANVADNRNGLWITVVKSKQEMIRYLPADLLPLEFGGNLGHLGDLLDQWNQHLIESRDFFVYFEKKMTVDYRRRICHEEEVARGGKGWVSKMKLEADEWDYKTQYYENMKNKQPLTHRGFGKYRVKKEKDKHIEAPFHFLRKRKQFLKEQEKANWLFNPVNSSHLYPPETKTINADYEKKEESKLEQNCSVWLLEPKILNCYIQIN